MNKIPAYIALKLAEQNLSIKDFADMVEPLGFLYEQSVISKLADFTIQKGPNEAAILTGKMVAATEHIYGQ